MMIPKYDDDVNNDDDDNDSLMNVAFQSHNSLSAHGE